MSELIDPEGLARQRPQRLLDLFRSLTWDEAVSSVAALVVTGAIFTLPRIGVPPGVIAIAVSFIASVAAGGIRRLYNANERLTTHIEKLRLEKAVVAVAARQASEEEAAAKRQLADAQNQLRAVQTYLDMQDLSDTTQLLDGVSHEVVQLARRDAVQMGKILHALTTDGVVHGSTYEEQLRFAEYFVDLAKAKVWATCIDRPSDFESRNHYYLDSFDRLARRLPSMDVDGAPPAIARIFVITAEDLRNEITTHPERLLRLYSRHLVWGQGSRETMRFFLGDAQTLIRTFGDRPAGMPLIPDFMVVDERFVYGRSHGDPEGAELILGYTDSQQCVAYYKSWYERIWDRCRTLAEALEDLKVAFAASQHELNSFGELCMQVRGGMEVEREYGHLFGEEQRKAMPFYRRVLDLIEQGAPNCIAIDRADLKASARPWKSWKQYPYVEFAEASKRAAKRAIFQRLFILEEWPEASEINEVGEFLADFAQGGVQVGLLHVRDANLDRITEMFATDFVVVGLAYGRKVQPSTLGFGLLQERFDPNRLDWKMNLIIKRRIPSLVDIFERLWNEENVVRVTCVGGVGLALEILKKHAKGLQGG